MSEIRKIPISRIIMTGDNPRQNFNEESLRTLGESIRTHGLLQPIIVRPKGNYFELVVGERRTRASELVGITEIEARIEEMDDATVMELRLIENTQREDLTNAEKGDAVYILWDKFPQKYPTITSVAEAINVPYGTIQNWCAKSRKLSEKVRTLIARNELTERAAQLMLKYDHDTQDKLAEAIVEFDIRGGRKGAERDFIKLYDENPEADLKELAEKAKGFKIVSIPLKKLSEEAREEVEEVLKEKEKEIEETRKKAIERARKAPRRKRPDIVVTKAEELKEKLNELEPRQREAMTEAVVRRIDSLGKRVDKDMLRYAAEVESKMVSTIKQETPERYTLKIQDLLHGIWDRIGVEYPQSVKEANQKHLVASLDSPRLNELQRTVRITTKELEDFNNFIARELFTRRSRLK